MAKKSGLGQLFFVNGYDLSGDVGSIDSLGSPRPVLEITGIDKSAVERILGHGDGHMTFNTWFNDATEAEHAALKSLPTADVNVLWVFETTMGDVAVGLVGKQVNYDWTRGSDGSLAGTIQVLASGQPLEWLILQDAAITANSGAGNGNANDNGASTSLGLVAYQHIKSMTTGSITIVLDDSPNNSSWSTLMTFTTVADGSEPAAERKTVSGAINRYIRIRTTGDFANIRFVLAHRRGTAQDYTTL